MKMGVVNVTSTDMQSVLQKKLVRKSEGCGPDETNRWAGKAKQSNAWLKQKMIA